MFLVLAVATAAIELWAIPNAWWIGVTEWWTGAPPLLPSAGRAVGMVVLPAAVAWASPRRPDANAWLWKGALLVAVVQLLRYPQDVARGWLIDTLFTSADVQPDSVFTLANVALSLPFAIASILGICALGEGLKDAGGRAVGVVPAAVVVTFVPALLFGIPAVMSGIRADLDGVLLVVSLAFNAGFVFVEALFAGRAVAGALAGVPPRRAWATGAIAASVLFIAPLVSSLLLLASSLLTAGTEPLAIPWFAATTFFGWPLVAVAFAAGMGRVRSSPSAGRRSSFVIRGSGRFGAAGADAALGA